MQSIYGKNMPLKTSNSALYTRRSTIAALVYDFPADEPLVNGLRGMQAYYATRNGSVDIPVLRVMNTAHMAAAYLFNTIDGAVSLCDRIAYENTGCDKQLTALVLIVLAEMLARTNGQRTRQWRSALLEQRSEDFYEGMSLYQQFIEEDERYFAEEDFLIDIMDNINILRAENQQLKQQIQQQKHQLNSLKTMAEQQPQTIINMQGGTYIAQQNIDIHDNPHANIYACPQRDQATSVAGENQSDESEDSKSTDTSFFCTDRFADDIVEKNIRQAIQLASSKADACRRIMALETYGYIVLSNVNDARKAELINQFAASKYTFKDDDFSYTRRNT